MSDPRAVRYAKGTDPVPEHEQVPEWPPDWADWMSQEEPVYAEPLFPDGELDEGLFREELHPRARGGKFARKALGVRDVQRMQSEAPARPREPSFMYPVRLAKRYGLTPEEKHELTFQTRETYDPVDYIAAGAARWRREHGLPEPQVDLRTIRASLTKGQKVAEAFEGVADESHRPEVQQAFEDFKRQNEAMWDFMTRPESEGGLGIKVDFTDHKDPYRTAEEQAEDLRQNHHITIESGLGGDHPLMTREEYDRFRAVHDVFGHAGVGGGFDRHGEYQAWLSHMSMYQGAGRDAMSSEYHGVNSSMWAGNAAGTGAAKILPSDLIRSPFDNKGRLVRK